MSQKIQRIISSKSLTKASPHTPIKCATQKILSRWIIPAKGALVSSKSYSTTHSPISSSVSSPTCEYQCTRAQGQVIPRATKEKKAWTQATSRACMSLAWEFVWTKMQSYQEGPHLQDGTAQICLWCIPLTPQMSLGAKKVATADGYTDSFLWNSSRWWSEMSGKSLLDWSYRNLWRRW